MSPNKLGESHFRPDLKMRGYHAPGCLTVSLEQRKVKHLQKQAAAIAEP